MQNIILVGMPSSGKTSLGKQLAKKMGYQFLDLDARIAQDAGLSIAELFAQHGETHFRELERVVLRRVTPNNTCVVSTGGGTPCYFDNMDFINAVGTSVFLDVSLDELHRRLVSSPKTHRPLYDHPEDPNALRATLEATLLTRRPFYERADVRVASDALTMELVWKALMR